MAPHEIATHLEVQDKLVFGLTARQALAIGLGLCMGYVCFQQTHLYFVAHQIWLIPLVLRSAVGALCGLVGIILAFVRPLDRPLETWLLVWLRYQTLPKQYRWRQAPGHDSCDPGHEEAELAALSAAVASPTPHEDAPATPSHWVGRFAPTYQEVAAGE
jgi:hypothetical protein